MREAGWGCTLCGQEARTLGTLGIFCGAANKPQGGIQAPVQAAHGTRSCSGRHRDKKFKRMSAN